VQSGERVDAAGERHLGSSVTNRYDGEFRRVQAVAIEIAKSSLDVNCRR
jgi:hypothetical protein